MGKQLVLISHGLFCEELKKEYRNDHGASGKYSYCRTAPSESAEDFRENLKKVAGLDEFVVLADLMGGTPCNVVSRMILEGQSIELYAGMNMPMVIDFINSELIGTEMALVDSAVNNICHVNERISNDDEEDE